MNGYTVPISTKDMKFTRKITRINGKLSTVDVVLRNPRILLRYGEIKQHLMNIFQEEGKFKTIIIVNNKDVPKALKYLDRAGYGPKGIREQEARSRLQVQSYSRSQERSRPSRKQKAYYGPRDQPYGRLKPRRHPRGWGYPGLAKC